MPTDYASVTTQRTFSRSQASFVLSVLRLFSLNKPVYFWTFTFVKVHDEWQYSKLWAAFIKGLEYAHGNRSGRGRLFGLRVVEPHEQHGLHYHALLNVRLSVHIVRRVGRRFGIGRVHVDRVQSSDAPIVAMYLAKYLAKRKEFATRIRSWGAIGGMLVCRGKDVEIDSPYSRVRSELVGSNKLNYATSSYLYHMSRLRGDIKNWLPMERAQVHGVLRREGVLKCTYRRKVTSPF